MKKIALIYGVIAGAVTIGSMIIGYIVSDGKGLGSSQLIGFTFMIIAFSMIFFGVKSYRDNTLGGVIGFKPAFGLGILIALVAGITYVIGWEVYLAMTDHQFIQTYTANYIEIKQAKGATPEEMEKAFAQMEEIKKNYPNPFYRVPVTFTEIFPVGAIIALISAAILRNPNVLPKHH